jgi:hypothetical protein
MPIAVLEMQTVHRDGSETWYRQRCISMSQARVEATLRSMSFYDVMGRQAQHEKNPDLMPAVGQNGDWYVNDYGEPCCVRAVEYDERDEGIIALGVFKLASNRP